MNNHVIILDPSQIYTDAICRLLYEVGVYNTSTALTPEQFVTMEPALENASLIILDIMFPTSEQGFQVLKRLKENPRFVKTPVIIITERAQAEVEKGLSEYPVAEYIEKPYSPEHLLEILNTLLTKWGDTAYDFSKISPVQLTPAAYIERELKVATRLGLPLSLLVISPLSAIPVQSANGSLDEGCLVPPLVRNIVQGNLRAIDQVFLNGNDEILAVLPATDGDGAEKALEKIVNEVKQHLLNEDMKNCGNYYGVTVSFPQDGSTLDELMQSAFSMINSKKQLEKLSSNLDKQMARGHYIYKKTQKYM